jgi:hypothetical protein
MPHAGKVIALTACLLVGCAPTPAVSPSTLPPLPNAFSIDAFSRTYTNEVFTVRYPAGWRVITPPAAARPSVTLAGTGCTTIAIAPDTAPAVIAPDCAARADHALFIRTAQVSAGDAPSSQVIALTLTASTQAWHDAGMHFDAVLRSLQPAGAP